MHFQKFHKLFSTHHLYFNIAGPYFSLIHSAYLQGHLSFRVRSPVKLYLSVPFSFYSILLFIVLFKLNIKYIVDQICNCDLSPLIMPSNGEILPEVVPITTGLKVFPSYKGDNYMATYKGYLYAWHRTGTDNHAFR